MKAIKAHWARDTRTIKEELGGSFHDVVMVARAHVNKVIIENESLTAKVEGMQKAMQDIHDKLNNGASHEFEETIQYCITKAFYALKGNQ